MTLANSLTKNLRQSPEARAKAQLELRKRRGELDNDDYAARCAKVYGSVNTYEQRARHTLGDDYAGYYIRARIVLQPRQLEFAALLHEADDVSKPREIGFGGAQSGGKSFVALATVSVECQRTPDLKVLYLRYTGKAAREQLYDQTLRVLQYVECDVNTERITFPNGSRIVIGGFKDDRSALTYQGQEYDIIVFEETTQLSERTYLTLRRSLRSSKGYRPRALCPTNPLGIGHLWYKKRFVDAARKHDRSMTAFVPATVDDNAFVDPEYTATLEELRGAELRAFRFGDWDVAAGAYFESWDYDVHVIPPLERIHPGWSVYAAMDAGYSHWNATGFIAEDGDGNLYMFEEIGHRKMHPEEISPDILNAIGRWGVYNQIRSFVAGTDAFSLRAGQKETIAEQYAQYGIALVQADMTPGSRILGWQNIAHRLGDPRNGKPARLFICSNCERTIETLPYLMRDPNHLEDVLKVDCDEFGRGGDDFGDMLRYGVASVPGAYIGFGNVAYDDHQYTSTGTY